MEERLLSVYQRGYNDALRDASEVVGSAQRFLPTHDPFGGKGEEDQLVKFKQVQRDIARLAMKKESAQ